MDPSVPAWSLSTCTAPAAMSIETGRLADRLPYAKAGSGQQPLVVLPGFGDAMWLGRYTPSMARLIGGYFARFRDTHSVYVVSRQRGLPADYTIEAMARDHADALAEIAPATILGISMGGCIAQTLAAYRPDVVASLVLAVTGARMSPQGQEDAARWRTAASNNDWAAIRAGLSREMYSDWRQFTYPYFLLTAGRPFVPRPADPSDVDVSLAALQAYDGRDRLGDIDARTLVIGGEHDPYFPPPILQELADGIPSADVSIIQGAKHGAFHERKATFDSRVATFLHS